MSSPRPAQHPGSLQLMSTVGRLTLRVRPNSRININGGINGGVRVQF